MRSQREQMNIVSLAEGHRWTLASRWRAHSELSPPPERTTTGCSLMLTAEWRNIDRTYEDTDTREGERINTHTHTWGNSCRGPITVIVSEVISKLHFLEIKKEKLESKFFIIVSICSAASSSSANIRPPDVNVLFFHRALFYYKTRNTCHQTLTALTLCCACLWKINNDQIIN